MVISFRDRLVSFLNELLGRLRTLSEVLGTSEKLNEAQARLKDAELLLHREPFHPKHEGDRVIFALNVAEKALVAAAVDAIPRAGKQASKPKPAPKLVSGQFVGDPAKVRVSVCEGRNILTRSELERQEAEATARRQANTQKAKKLGKKAEKPAKKEKGRRAA